MKGELSTKAASNQQQQQQPVTSNQQPATSNSNSERNPVVLGVKERRSAVCLPVQLCACFKRTKQRGCPGSRKNEGNPQLSYIPGPPAMLHAPIDPKLKTPVHVPFQDMVRSAPTFHMHSNPASHAAKFGSLTLLGLNSGRLFELNGMHEKEIFMS